jgi:membrane protein YqaA with SNARE-associated domain
MKIHFSGLKRLYTWTLQWADHSRAPWVLFIVSFAEASLFLIPPDVILVPMTLARPRMWLRFATITVGGSVLGGIFGYYIGIGLWESLGTRIVELYHLQDSVTVIRVQFDAHAFLTIFGAAFTPIPYKVITIASGLFRVSFITFLIASIVGRSLRFFLIAGLVGVFGERMKQFIDDYFEMLSLVLLALLVGGFIMLRLFIQ